MSAAKILIVEDVHIAQKIVVLVLQRLGCDVDAADDGAMAISFAEQNHYDLIFMDLGLPDMEGVAVIEAIRQLEQSGQRERAPIIVLTAHTESGCQERCGDADIDGFLEKPLTLDAARATLQQFLD